VEHEERRMRALTVSFAARDSVRVSRVTGLTALEHLYAPGSVLVDPDSRVLYFFVPSGSAAGWALPGVVVRPAGELRLPPAGRSVPPGAYWLTTVSRGLRCIPPVSLLAAIEAALRSGQAGTSPRAQVYDSMAANDLRASACGRSEA
jgi:hypothetical protein